ncbi:MAG TPA: DUF1549 domain-containing protein, partial [Gemmataceae bacterium]|nr:DUF1549 domain-containing protein [Gemmataceae bacterium]
MKAELKKAGRDTDIMARLRAIADEDSDGDGIPNLLELLAGHNPGESSDKPSQPEIAVARRKMAYLLRQSDGYPWTPFKKVARPLVPTVKATAWVRNPIDAFIAAEHEKHGLKPRPEAPPEVLLRRVFLDLTGLPPTPKELHEFLEACGKPGAGADPYQQVVDKLLASAQYGERWGRHWMDIWRYSDWAGYKQEVRDSQPHIWHWRDWIIESLNADKGYDRMIVEMLAADELAPSDSANLRATGFLARNFDLYDRHKQLQDTVEHTFLAFQGVTINCARCHDHMYDPILQKEYYQVRAIFEPYGIRMDRWPGEPDLKKNGLPRVYDAHPTMPTHLLIRGDVLNPDKTPLPPGTPELLGGGLGTIEPVALPKDAYAPDQRAFVIRENNAVNLEAVARARKELDAARAKMAALPAAGAQKALDALVLAELDAMLAEARHASFVAVQRAEELVEKGLRESPEGIQAGIEATRSQRRLAVLTALRTLTLARQEEQNTPAGKKREEAAMKSAAAAVALTKAEEAAKMPASPDFTRPTTYPVTSTGRRLALARWIANKDNPLTARVAMNHIWLRHFGQAIVPSVFEFGRNGLPPSHPALLDWLASEFME